MESMTLRPARKGDGEALLDVTRRSVEALAPNHYSAEQIAGWMGDRTPDYYENLIAQGQVVVAEYKDTIMGFVDAEPGEVTCLFLLPGAAGSGLGAKLLNIGIKNARKGHLGPIKVESTINAEGFYRRHGFRTVRRGYFSHGLGGDPVEIVHMELSP
jgi:N-acetylglutamate synthase-like GNAT family acetyltransferase